VALDPNLIAHAALAQVDVAMRSVRWRPCRGLGVLQRPTLLRGALLGAATGFAFGAKFAAVLLLPAVAWPLAARCWAGGRPVEAAIVDGACFKRCGPTRGAGGLCPVDLCGLWFQGVGQRLDETTWQSGPLRWAESFWARWRLRCPWAS